MNEIWNLGTLCRCCHSDGCFKSLKELCRTENSFETYETMLQDVLAIKISQPPSPVEASYTICDDCITKLRDAALFRQQVITCEHKFQIYCNNEQFPNGAVDSVKLEVQSVAAECDDQEMDFDDRSSYDKTLDEPVVSVKQEISIEVDFANPITKQEEDGCDEKPVKIEEEAVEKKKESPINKRIRNKKTNTTDNKSIRNNNFRQIHRKFKTNNSKSYSCKTCGGCYQTKKELYKHVSLQHRARYKCEQCGKHFTLIKNLIRHKEQHLNKNECNECGKLFSCKANLKAHENIHTKQKVYQCDICKKELKYKNTLRKHILEMHTDHKELLCDFCGWAFKQRSNLEAHIRTVHLKQRPFPCQLCNKTYTAKKHLKNHIKTAHSGNPKPYECDVCSKKFACQKSLKIHRLTHDNQFTCRYCFMIFNNKNDCDAHTKTHSIETCISTRYGCPICGKILKTKFTLNRHIELHSGVKKFSCSICGLKFTQKALVYRHKRMKHDPNSVLKLEKTKCNLCKRPYRNMEKHMATHSSEAKKYFCDICGKSYSENNALTRHKNQKHFGVSHDCELCGKKYINKRSLETHKFKVHKIKKEIVDGSNFDDVKVAINVI